MNARRSGHPPLTPDERAHLSFRTLGTAMYEAGWSRWNTRRPENEMLPLALPVSERVRRLPEALLLTAGYYASRTPVVGGVLRRRN